MYLVLVHTVGLQCSLQSWKTSLLLTHYFFLIAKEFWSRDLWFLFVCLFVWLLFFFLKCVYLFFCRFLWLLPKLFQIGWNKKRDLDILVSQWFGLLRNAHKIRHRLVRAWRTWNIFWSSLTEKEKNTSVCLRINIPFLCL